MPSKIICHFLGLKLLLEVLEIKKWEVINFTLATRIQVFHINEIEEDIIVSDIPKIMLNSLNLLNYESRTLSNSLQKLFSPNEEQNPNELNYLELMLEDKEKNSSSVHPMDIFLLIFFSCDKIYRQKFVVKVAKCQLSLPLIAFDPFSQKLILYSFSFQKLFKECSLSDSKKYEFPVVDHPMNTVSALRIGSEGMERSKSKLLNDLLNVSHSYFFHRSCEGSVQTNYLLNQTVEIGWYLPSGKKDNFEEPLTFLNLRGDATSLQKQLTFLLSVSNVLLIFISPQHFNEDNIQVLEYIFERVNSRNSSEEIPHLILVVESLGKRYDLRKLKDYKPNQSNLIKLCKNEAEDKSKFINAITTGLKNSDKKRCINDFIGHAQRVDIFSEEIDESDIQINSAEVQSILMEEMPQDHSQVELSEVKVKMLPLQGTSWKKMAENYRNFYRKTKDQQHDVKLKRNERENIRKQQLEYLRQVPSYSMQHILGKVKEFKYSNSEVFWRLFQNELDKLSKRYIPELYKQYKEERDVLFEESRNHPNRKLSDLNNKLDQISQNISKSSLGIEHVFRELSQIYEVCKQSSNTDFTQIMNSLQIDPNDLIIMASRLLLSGFQLEILDGDVSHIPTKWVSDILFQLSSLIGHSKRFYVISVLGVQSSGKSTLLNTMFGLEFAVSAGKCTKGAFMHLVHIEPEAAQQLGYDYILIIDTEGLRAPELAAQETYLHDNEIATFAIGLADLTIINILGEHSNEIQDILQITIYALIRMRKASVKPKCMFVHQNAAAINMENILAVNTRNFVQLLDEITLTAAKKEKVSDLFQNFNSVIEFNPKEDIFYFPTLFKGDPPMAPINPGYCEAADKLRRFVLLKSAELSQSCLTLPKIAMKVKDLWDSVLKEDFVFNYKNVQELNALYELDSAQSQWTALFTQLLSVWVRESSKMIECKEGDDLEILWNEMILKLRELVDTICMEEQERIKSDFFINHPSKELLSPREETSDIFFKSLRDKEFQYSFSSLKEIYNKQKHKRVIQNMFNDAEKNLYQNIMDEFGDSKETFAGLTNIQISEIFDDKWKKLTQSIPNQGKVEVIDIQVELKKLLTESPRLQDVKLADKKTMLNDFSNFIEFCTTNQFPVDDKYIKVHPSTPLKKSNIDSSEITFEDTERLVRQKLENIVQHVRDECDELVANKCDSNMFFSFSYFEWIIESVKNACETESKRSENVLPNQFINDLIFYECCRKVTHFEGLQKEYIEHVSVSAMLESKKPEYKNYFIRKWKGIADEIIAALKLSTILITEITNIANEKMKKGMLDHFLKLKKFSTKFQLQMSVLGDLCQEEKFTEYLLYIKNPIDYIEFWLLNKMKQIFYVKENNEFALKIFETEREDLIHFSIKSATAAINSISMEIKKNILIPSNLSESEKKKVKEFWKELFLANIDEKINFNAKDELNFFNTHTICDFDRFITAFKENMRSFEVDCVPLTFCMELKNQIVRSFIQCKSCCRFCNELCTLNAGEHKHSCGVFHRPHCLKPELLRHYQPRERLTTSIILRENPNKSTRSLAPNQGKKVVPIPPLHDPDLPQYDDVVSNVQAPAELDSPVNIQNLPVDDSVPDLAPHPPGYESDGGPKQVDVGSRRKLDYSDCSTKVLVGGKFQIKPEHFINNYAEIASDWDIDAGDSKNSIYWKWVIVNFHDKLFGQEIDLPEEELLEWKSITKNQVLSEIEELMKRCPTNPEERPNDRSTFMQGLFKIFPFMKRFF